MYEVRMELRHGDDVLAERTDTFGIRTVELIRSETTSTERSGEFL